MIRLRHVLYKCVSIDRSVGWLIDVVWLMWDTQAAGEDEEVEDIGEMFAVYGGGGSRAGSLKTSSRGNLNRLSPFSVSSTCTFIFIFLFHSFFTFFLSPRRLCFLPVFVCLSVCLSVSKITQKVMDGSF